MMFDIKKIKWLYFARLFSLTGSQILFFVVPLLIFKMTHSAVYTGIAFSLEWTARIISFPLSGLCADKFGARKSYIISDFMISLLALIAVGIMTYYHAMTILVLVILSVSAGFLAEIGYVSAESLAPKLVKASYYAKSQSILELLEQFALLFGPTIAGAFILYFNPESLIYLSIVLYALSAISMIKINVSDITTQRASENIKKELIAGFTTIRKDSYLINIVILSIMMNFVFGLMTGAAPVMVLGVYSMSDSYYALLNLGAGMAGVLAILILNMLVKKYSIISMGIVAYIVACFLCIFAGYVHSYSSYLMIYALFYAFSGIFSIFFRSERARIIPVDVLGRTIGVIIFITFLLFPASGLLISLTHQYFSLNHVISFVGLGCLILGATVFTRTHKISRVAYNEG